MKAFMTRIWAGQILIGLVFFFNIQCALAFLWSPQRYAPGFELEGVVGAGMVRALGLLFLMWNVPYFVALIHPVSHHLSVMEAVGMQAIGFFGEVLLFLSFPAGHQVIQATVTRFAIFDGLGLLALLLAARLTRPVVLKSFLAAPSH